MKIPVIRPFEHAVPSLSIDTKLNDTTIRKGGVLTSELGEVEDTYGIYDSILSPTTTLVDELPQLQPVYLVQTIDVNKHRIMHLQRYKHVLRLVMLCTTICWAALTVVFALLILHQVATKDNNQHTSGSHPNYTLIFVLVMIAVSVGISQLTASQADLHVNGCLDVATLEEKKNALASRVKKSISPPKTEPVIRCTNSSPDWVLETQPADIKPVTVETDTKAMLLEIENTQLAPEKDSVNGYRFVYDCVSRTNNGSSKQRPKTRPHKPLPSYKTIPGTSFTVDAFKYGQPGFCTAFFLTHFHSDHYGGLTKIFAGHIYCSRITANCVTSILGVNPSNVHALPMNTRCIVHGVYVTLLDAEHCPGAAIVLFEIPSEGGKVVRVVHTGDFRASNRQVRQISRVFATDLQTPVTPEIITRAKALDSEKCNRQTAEVPFVDYVYLDTTYLDPQYTFPRQSQVIKSVGEFCRLINADPDHLSTFLLQHRSNQLQSPHTKRQKHAQITTWFQPKKTKPRPRPNTSISEGMGSQQGDNRQAAKKPHTLFVVGTYSIGKERLFIEIARAVGARVYVAEKKRRIVESIASSTLCSLVTSDMLAARVHAVPMGIVNMRGMAEYLEELQKKGGSFTRVVAFCPTGWTHAAGPGGRFAGPVDQASPDAWPMRIPTTELDEACAHGDAAQLTVLFARSARLNNVINGECGFSHDRMKPRGSSAKVTIFPVPYSEHSSFSELARFVCSLNIGRIVPTVFSSSSKNAQANAWLSHWQDLKAEFLQRAKQTVACRQVPMCLPTFCPAAAD
ncbi:DNA cross-link repair protein PSO2/SNM1 [Coemansia sp. RSA 1646]|nr:DNA cross-link repair protein PSO2/SNM1 [Coemansia sp. RSA 1646]KAJ2093684.1 repair protein PSO2 SNM1 [Coemansia sp. RSA 986]